MDMTDQFKKDSCITQLYNNIAKLGKAKTTYANKHAMVYNNWGLDPNKISGVRGGKSL